MTNQKRRGRPPIGPAIEVRFTADDLHIIDAAAHRAGLTRAAFIRRTMNAQLTVTQRYPDTEAVA